MATPPPRSTRAHTPPTPLHGPAYDDYEPYSPRRSTRATAHNNPYSSFNGGRSPKAPQATTPPATVKKTRFARAPTQLSSPPSSPASPARHRTPRSIQKTPRKEPFSSQRRAAAASGALSDSDGGPSQNSLAPPNIDPFTMLPTPSKTPKKRQAAVTSTARVLNFQPSNPNDVMPSSRQLAKQRRKNNSNTMAGFELYEDDAMSRNGNGESIEIYTDASARVPEMDESEDNPFVGPRRVQQQRPQRRSRKSAAQMEQDAQIDEAARKDEGVVYVFRGKKIFRRFQDPNAHATGSDAALSSAGSEVSGSQEQRLLKRQAGAAARRPLTRSTIKPRLLFPSDEQLAERQRGPDDVDEEAVTDIEMGDGEIEEVEVDAGAERETETPRKNSGAAGRVHFKLATPPPTTSRATRSKKASPVQQGGDVLTPEAETAEPGSSFDSAASASGAPGKSGKGKGKGRSPFDGWQREKPGKRRAGEEPEGAGGVAKRTRAGGQ